MPTMLCHCSEGESCSVCARFQIGPQCEATHEGRRCVSEKGHSGEHFATSRKLGRLYWAADNMGSDEGKVK